MPARYDRGTAATLGDRGSRFCIGLYGDGHAHGGCLIPYRRTVDVFISDPPEVDTTTYELPR